MVPATEVAAHHWCFPAAAVTRTRNVSVVGSGNELLPFPHRMKFARTWPRQTAPARASWAENECPPPALTRTVTSHAPAAHAGMACQNSVSCRLPKTRRMYVTLTLHEPCRRAWEMGGVRVLTVRTALWGDR